MLRPFYGLKKRLENENFAGCEVMSFAYGRLLCSIGKTLVPVFFISKSLKHGCFGLSFFLRFFSFGV